MPEFREGGEKTLVTPSVPISPMKDN